MFAFFDLRGIRPALLILKMQGNINVQQSNMISCFEKKKMTQSICYFRWTCGLAKEMLLMFFVCFPFGSLDSMGILKVLC